MAFSCLVRSASLIISLFFILKPSLVVGLFLFVGPSLSVSSSLFVGPPLLLGPFLIFCPALIGIAPRISGLACRRWLSLRSCWPGRLARRLASGDEER